MGTPAPLGDGVRLNILISKNLSENHQKLPFWQLAEFQQATGFSIKSAEDPVLRDCWQRDWKLSEVKLELTLWEGKFEAVRDAWLRWADDQRSLIPTGKEQAEQAERLLTQEQAEKERLLARLRERRKTTGPDRNEPVGKDFRPVRDNPEDAVYGSLWLGRR